MKRMFIMAGVALVAGLASCAKEQTGQPETSSAGRQITITASAPATRVGVDGQSVVWKKGDQIEIFYAADGINASKATTARTTFKLDDACDGQVSGTFTGTIPPGAASGHYYASYAWLSTGLTAISALPAITSVGMDVETDQIQKGAKDPASLGLYSRFWAERKFLNAAPASGDIDFVFHPITCILDIPLTGIKPGEKVKKVTVKGGQGDPQSDYAARTLPFMTKWFFDKTTFSVDNFVFGGVPDEKYKPSVSVTLDPAQTAPFTASIAILPRDVPTNVSYSAAPGPSGPNGAQDTPRDLEIIVTVDTGLGDATYTIDKSGTEMFRFVPGVRYATAPIDLSTMTVDPPVGAIPDSPPGGSPDINRADMGKENGIQYPYGTGENQWLVYYPVVKATGKVPVYVWAHPNGANAKPPYTQTANSFGGNTISDCNNNGIAVISWESVPQVITNDDVNTCQDDLVNVYNWMNQYKDDLNIDMSNVFIGGMSRGTVVSWNFICTQYSKIRGAYLAQVLPSSVWFYPDGTYEQNYNNQVLNWITVNNPPVYLTYSKTEAEAEATGDNHKPKYGQWVQNRYQELGIGDRCTFVEGNKANYNQLVNFIKSNLYQP